MRKGFNAGGVPAAVCVLSIFAATLAAQTPESTPAPGLTPGDFYRSYLSAIQTMRSLKDVERFLPEKIVTGMAANEKQNVERLRGEAISDVTILKQTPQQRGYLLEMEGTRRSDSQRVKGWARIARDGNGWKVAKDDWTSPRPPAPPRIPGSISVWGGAIGDLTVNGETAKLAHSWAREIPEGTDRSKIGYVVTVSDVPFDPKVPDSAERAKAGALHAIELTFGPDTRLKEAKIYHREFENGVLRPAEPGRFAGEQMGPELVAGRAFVEAPVKVDGRTYSYAVTFRAPVQWEAKP